MTLKKSSYLLAAAVGAALTMSVVAPVEAATLNTTYKFNSQFTVSTFLEGTLGADNNSFVVTGLDSVLLNGTPVTLNGLPLAPMLSASSVDTRLGLAANKAPTVTLDGSYLDFALEGQPGEFFLAFAVADLASQDPRYMVNNNPNGIYLVQDASGTMTMGSYDRSSYSAALVPTAVPEPASMALLGAGLVGMAAVRRRKAA